MFAFLKNHPFAVEAFFERSTVLTFAVPKEELRPLIPVCLDLDTLNDRWAFMAVAMVQTTQLRPKGFPKAFGNNFFLIGYRVFVQYVNTEGRRLRGLFILKSETDKKMMERLGNMFTKYQYTTTDISQTREQRLLSVKSVSSNFEVEIDIEDDKISLPQNSPFTDWKEARRFAGPLPFTFSFNEETKEVLIIEGVRQNWQPLPVNVISHHISYLNSLNLKQVQLANAFVITHVPYHWKKGVIEKWNA